MKKTLMTREVCLLALSPVGLAMSTLGAPVVHKNVYLPATVVLEDFSGATDPSTDRTANTTFTDLTGGAATYNYAALAGPEGNITYNPLAKSFDPTLHESIRVRMAVNRDSAATTGVEVFVSPIGTAGGGSVTKSTSSGTTLTETSFDISTKTPNGLGMRIDPFNYTNDATDDEWQIDYIMADIGPTIGFEFNHDEDFNQLGLVGVSPASVLNGVLSGEASTGDPNLWVTGDGGATATIDPNIYKFVEIRMKGHSGDIPRVYWKAGTRIELTPSLALEESTASADDQWRTYLIDFSNEADWTGTLTHFRIDPVNEPGRTFEVDYIRFMAVRGPEAPIVLFQDDFDDSVDTSVTDPAGRATGTLATVVKYAWSDTNATDVVVDGTLNWDSDGNKTAANEQPAATGSQSLRFGSAVNSGHFNWFPYLGGKVWEIEFNTLTANSHPLTFGLSDTPLNGAFNSWDSASYDLGVGSYGSALRYDTDNDAGAGLSNINSIFPSRATVYSVRIRVNEVLGKATIHVNGTQRAETTSLDFENNARYLTFGEPTNYAGFIDNLKISVIPGTLPDPFALVSPLEVVENGNLTQITDVVAGAAPSTYNIAGSFGDFSGVWGSSAVVTGWSPYYSDPDGLTAHIGQPGVDDTGVLNGTFYLDTQIDTTPAITLNSSNNYRNGIKQEDILNGVNLQAGATYQLKIDVSQGSASTDQSQATFTAALTQGAGSTNPATAVPGSLISVAASSLPTARGVAFQTATISGADLLAAQANGPVNLIFEHLNTDTIANFPEAPDPQDLTQVSQLRIARLSLLVVNPANDLNKDGVFDSGDVALANLYLAGDGGETAEARQADLVGQGLAPLQALAYLNLSDFDIDADGTFDAADVAALEALLTAGPDPTVVINSATFVGGQFVLQISDLTVGRQYRLMRGTNLIQFDVEVDSVTAGSSSATLTDPNPPAGDAFYRIAN